MTNITLWSFDPDADPTYKKTWTDRAIQLRSQLTHTTKQYSSRYGGISCSATMKGGYDCVRFKMNDYTKHPLRWKSIIIPCTDEQEDLIFAEDCRMADVPVRQMANVSIITQHYTQEAFFGPNAMKYDKLGVVLCNISHRRIIKSWADRCWCSESCIMAILAGHPSLTDKHPDTFNPDNGHKLVKAYAETVN